MNKGVVTGTDSRTVNTKFGPKEAYDLYINGLKYSAGFKKPPVVVGDDVEFEYTTDKYGNKITSIRHTGSGGYVKVPTPALKTPTGSYQPKIFPVPVDSGERAILRQNALTNARELVTAFLNIDIPDTSKKEVQKVFNTLTDEVIRIAYIFEEFTSGDRERHAAEAIMKKGKVEDTSV